MSTFLELGAFRASTRAFGTPVLILPAIKIEIENSLEMAQKRKAVARDNPIFGSVEPCDLLETANKSSSSSKL